MSELIGTKKDEFLKILENRFKQNLNYHKKIKWEDVEKKLESHPKKLYSLYLMEETKGEPDVVGYDKNRNEYIFMDTSKESPKGRVSLCYDRKALESRKKFKPQNSAQDLANQIGIELMNEEEYRFLQTLGEFDLKTSSWIKTPNRIRELGGALFADRRYNTIFIYHNGADSYYGVRGFRGVLKI